MELGKIADQIFKLKEIKKELVRKEKEINGQIEQLSTKLIGHMKDVELQAIKTDLCTASYKIETYFSVSDKEEFYKFVVESERWELAQARISSAPAREMMENEGLEPEGATSYLKETISIRKR